VPHHAGFAKRKNQEDENYQGNRDESQAEIARPEFGHLHMKNRAAGWMRTVRHS